MFINKKIHSLRAFEILDSRGIPSVHVQICLENGCCGSASVPSGASTGSKEAYERRDGNPLRYGGKSVERVCIDIEKKILPEIKGMNAGNQSLLDEKLISLDGSENKKVFGANAILAVSLAAARACANAYRLPLYRYLGGLYGANARPTPMMNVLNGGRHAENNIDIQEFMIVPTGADSFSEAVRIGAEIYASLREFLKKEGLSVSVGDEGGFAPNLNKDEDALDFLLEAICDAGYDTDTVKIAVDVAASEWEKDGKYWLPKRGIAQTTDSLIRKIETLCADYPILSIEDPLSEHDKKGWKEITKTLGNQTLLVGDDLFVTNPSLLKEGIQDGLANAILIKPNQIGTLTETMQTVRIAKENAYQVILSHRSGETCDSFISDLAIALGAQFLKAGAPARGEIIAKYNRLIEIEKTF